MCPKEIGPLDYHAKINELCPGLNESKTGSLNFSNIPTLKSVTYYNTDDNYNGVYNFDELINAGGSNESNIIKNLKIEYESYTCIMTK